MATGHNLVKRAFEQLDQTISREDLRYFQDTTLQSLWNEARRIEHEQGQRGDLRFMRRIEGFLRTMESYSGVIEVFCQGFSPMAFVWGPIKLALLLAKQYAGVMDKILQAYRDIADVLPRVDKLEAAFGDKADFQQVLGLLYTDILEFHRRSYKMFRRKAWHIWFAFDWGLFERRFKSILQRLASHCELLDREAAATHFLEMKRVREKWQIEEESHEEQRNSQLTRETLGWLTADEDSQEEYLHRLSDQRQVGTCDWILNETQVTNWMAEDCKDPVVWLTGIPGAGKSFLCSLIVQHSEIHQDRSTIYYFCGHRPSNAEALTTLLRTLAVQLLRQNLELAPFIHQAFLQKGSGRSAPAIKRILKDILSTDKVVRIVLDGIDEWDQIAQRDTLKTLVELQKHGGGDCKVLISSRNEPYISKAIPHKVHMHIDGQSAHGLKCYIETNIQELKDLFPDFSPEIWERVAVSLQNKARGMFLWVRLVRTMLEVCCSEVEFEKELERLPDGLDEAYGRILSRLGIESPTVRQRALRVLFWICTAYRSVKIDEVADGIALKPGQTDLNVKTRSQNPERDILEICAPMLEKTGDGVLTVVHFSAKEYLLHEHSGPFIHIPQAHLDVLFSCVANLTSALILVPSHSGSATTADIERSVATGSFTLHSYAHQYWMDHLLAYLGNVHDFDTCISDVKDALSKFCKVLKGYSLSGPQAPDPLGHNARFSELQKLHKFPALERLVIVWSHFKTRLAETIPSLESLDAQDKFSLENDQTYLSLVGQRLREIEEQILTMDRSALPPHIKENEYDAFVARCGFSCRNHGEEFMPRSSSSTRSSSIGNKVRCSWSEQGRKASQQSFRRILATVESRVSTSISDNKPQSLVDSKHALVSRLQSFETIRKGIEEQRYSSLRNFKDDVYHLLGSEPFSTTLQVQQDVDSICSTELERVISEFPAFAEADGTKPSRRRGAESAEGGSEDIQNSTDTSLQSKAAQAQSKPSLTEKRAAYWSIAEEKQMPELLSLYGRDLIKIADCLKTKTLMEIELHLIDRFGSERAQSPSRLEPIEGSPQSSVSPFDTTRNDAVVPRVYPFYPEASQGATRSTVWPPRYTTQPPGSNEITKDRANDISVLEATGNADSLDSNAPASIRPKRAPRRPRIRYQCTGCSKQFSDEYVTNKHYERLHVPTRQVWKCVDRSINKTFFSSCKACRSAKQYSTKRNAVKHLRDVHFAPSTPEQTLLRWMEQLEVRNSKYVRPENDSSPLSPAKAGDDNGHVSSSSGRAQKRRKIDNLPPIRQFSEATNDVHRLPAMRSTSGRASSASRESTPDTNPSNSELTSGWEIDQLADVSFDNLLPLGSLGTPNISDTFDSLDKSLIRPNQVHRLPHLDKYQQTLCSDQVEALYHVLTTQNLDSKDYKKANEGLVSLSRTLRKGLREWRQRSSFAPTLSFSI